MSGEAVCPQLGERPLGLAELETHGLQHSFCLREHDLVVLHDLDAVSERVEEVEAVSG